LAALSLILLSGTRLARGSGPEPVVRSLSGFVPASVRGLIRDAILAGPADNELRIVADHAGCAFIEAESEADALGEALTLACGTEILILHAGHVPETELPEAIGDLVASSQSSQRGWALRATPDNLAERLFPALAPTVGLIAARKLCLGVEAPTFANLLKATRARSAPGLRMRRIA
jgi:hypothetical protein